MNENLLRGMTRDGSARILVLNATEMVQNAMRIHHTAPTASAALGRVLIAASLMGCMLKDKENSLTLRFQGDGDAGTVLAVSDYMGNVKGTIGNPDADAPRKSNGKLDVRAVVGHGDLYVIRDTGEKKPYVGITKIVSGEIAEDIANYFAESEQIPTVCALGVLVGAEESCVAAGGVMIQLLPYAAEETVAKLEKNAEKLANVSDLFHQGLTNAQIAEIACAGVEFDVFDALHAEYHCDCSKERMARALLTLPPKELFDLLVKDGKIETRCHFCNRTYTFTGADIEEARKKAGRTQPTEKK